MKNRYLVGLFLSAFSFASVAEELYVVSSREMGISQFDFTVTEIKRGTRTSLLSIPSFHERSAAASRWMMCAYTDLAVKRGFEYWASIYPDSGNEEVLLLFPETESSSDAVFEQENIAQDDRQVSRVAVFARFCGIKLQ